MVKGISILGVPKGAERLVRDKCPKSQGRIILFSHYGGPVGQEEASWNRDVAFLVKIDKAGNSILAPNRRRETGS